MSIFGTKVLDGGLLGRQELCGCDDNGWEMKMMARKTHHVSNDQKKCKIKLKN